VTDSGGESSALKIQEIGFPDFDVSWAGSIPSVPGYWFGLDDGRVLYTADVQSAELLGPYAVAPSRDPINGITFVRTKGVGVLAASTRSEVVLMPLDVRSLAKSLIERDVYHGGAHGVAPRPNGCIAAPLGRHGLLIVGPKEIMARRVRVIKPPDDSLNLYRVVSIASPSRGEVLACAARHTGFVALPLIGEDLADSGKSFCPAGADFVDVGPLGMAGHPYAIAILALDCSIYLVRDLLEGTAAETLHYDFHGERAYRIICTGGHIFLLTNRRLYTFVDMASLFVEGRDFRSQVKFNSLDIEAVDMSLAFDGALLVVMPDCVYRIEIGLLIEGKALGQGRRAANGQQVHAGSSLSVSKEAMVSFSSSAWEQSEKPELLEVQSIG
jgi:hypothetical protein